MTAPSGAPARRVLIVRVARIALGAAAVIFVGIAVTQRWAAVSAQLSQINLIALAASGAALLASLAAGLLVWRGALAALGSPLPLRAAARVMLLGQLGKYVPGSLWSVMAQMELAHDLGVPRRRSAAAGLLFNALGLGLGLLIAVLALPTLLAAAEVPAWVGWVVAASPLALVTLAPPVLTRLTNLALRLLRRPGLERPFTWPGVLAATGWTLLMWVLTGVHVWVLGLALGADPVRFLLPAFGGFAAAWAAGFLFVLAPAGAGIRETLIVVTLAPALPGGTAAAFTLALVSRLLFVLGDVAAALLGHALGRRRTRGSLVSGPASAGVGPDSVGPGPDYEVGE